MQVNSQEYLERLAMQQMSYVNPQNTQSQRTNLTNGKQSFSDTFERTISDTEAAIPCENYGDIMEMIKANKQANGESEGAPTEEDFANALAQFESMTASDTTETDTTVSDTTTTESDTSVTTGTGTSSESDDSSSTETVTEMVRMPDGSIFLKTTTTAEDGTETVTMQKLAGGNGMMGMGRPMMPPMEEMSELAESDTTKEEETA